MICENPDLEILKEYFKDKTKALKKRSRPILVLKFGGSSVACPEKIKQVAEIIQSYVHQNYSIVVVVSAMGKTTDNLIKLSAEVNSSVLPHLKAQALLLASGEQLSCALLTEAISSLSLRAEPFTGEQAGFLTTSSYLDAHIIDLNPLKINQVLEQGKTAVVAGFQGVNQEGYITTLGRGGSDTTAVALAVALYAEKCIFFKDVPGICTANPKDVPLAKCYEDLSFGSLRLLTTLQPSGVLHDRAVQMAEQYDLNLEIKNTFDFKNKGTLIQKEEPKKPLVSFILKQEDTILFVGRNIKSQKEELKKALRSFNVCLEESSLPHILKISGKEFFPLMPKFHTALGLDKSL